MKKPEEMVREDLELAYTEALYELSRQEEAIELLQRVAYSHPRGWRSVMGEEDLERYRQLGYDNYEGVDDDFYDGDE